MKRRRRKAAEGGLSCGAAQQHRTVAVGQDTGEAPLRDGADDRSSRADARDREPAGSLAVVAGDAIAPPPRPEPAPWWSPAAETRRASRPGGDRAPFGFVPLAVVAVAFLLVPLAALLIRAPWPGLGRLLADARRARRRCACRCCARPAPRSSRSLLGVPLAWVLARVPFRGRDLVRALVTLPLVLPPVVGGVALLLAFGRSGILGQCAGQPDFGITLPFTTAGVDASPRRSWRCRSSSSPSRAPSGGRTGGLRGGRGDPRGLAARARSAGSRCR